MRAAQRFGDDPVDNPERLQVLRGDLHRFGGIGGLVRRAPQDRRAAFRRNDRINRMFEHQDAVGRGDRDRAAATRPRRRSRRSSAPSATGIPRSTGRSPPPVRALPPATPGKGARRIDQADDRKPEPVREPHQADRLAIAFRLGHSEIVPEARGGVVALFMPDQHDLAAVDHRQPADDRRDRPRTHGRPPAEGNPPSGRRHNR